MLTVPPGWMTSAPCRQKTKNWLGGYGVIKLIIFGRVGGWCVRPSGEPPRTNRTPVAARARLQASTMPFLDREHFTPHFFSEKRQGTVTGAVATLLGTLLGGVVSRNLRINVGSSPSCCCCLLTRAWFSASFHFPEVLRHIRYLGSCSGHCNSFAYSCPDHGSPSSQLV